MRLWSGIGGRILGFFGVLGAAKGGGYRAVDPCCRLEGRGDNEKPLRVCGVVEGRRGADKERLCASLCTGLCAARLASAVAVRPVSVHHCTLASRVQLPAAAPKELAELMQPLTYFARATLQVKQAHRQSTASLAWLWALIV